MAKSIGEVKYDRMKFGTLAATNADGSMTNEAAIVSITPPSSEYAVVPTCIFAQTELTNAFSITLAIADVWNQAPLRRVRVSRMDGEGQEVAGIDYALPRVGPKSAILQLENLEVAALQSEILRGKTLRVEMDGITADEWQALYVVYKIIKANDELRV